MTFIENLEYCFGITMKCGTFEITTWLLSTCYQCHLISFAGHYLNALNMRDAETSSFPLATQPLDPNNPYSPDGKSILS